MKAQGFKSIRSYQKLNHFPGSFQIGRKDRLWRNLSKLQVNYNSVVHFFLENIFFLRDTLLDVIRRISHNIAALPVNTKSSSELFRSEHIR